MGGVFTSISEFFFAKPEVEFRLQIIGFAGAGKTTILQRLKFIEQGQSGGIDTVPTIGVNIEEISMKNVKLKVYDLSGQQTMRTTWKYYYETVNGLVFVVDSSSKQE